MPRVRKIGTESREERITKIFKKALIDKDWSQQHLADLCGMEKGYVSKIINSPMKRRFSSVIEIASKLGLDSLPI